MPTTRPEASAPLEPSRPPGQPSTWRGWVVLFFFFLLVYGLTAQRGTQWQDSGYHILRAVTHQTVNPMGLALSHPLHQWIAQAAVGWGLFRPCLSVTLVSALMGALTVANIFGCVVTLTGSRKAAVLGAVSFALAHTVWQMSTLAETYTLASALLTGECWCIARFARDRDPRFLAGTFFLNGLGISNHLLALLTTPVLFVVALITIRSSKFEVRSSKTWAGVGGLLWVLGASPYLGFFAVEGLRSGDLWATLHSAFFGHGYRADVLNVHVSPRALGLNICAVVMNFPNLLLPVAAYGALGAGQIGIPKLARRALLASVTVHAVFVLRYTVADRFTFFVPMYALLAIFAGIGWARIAQWPIGRSRTLVRRASVAAILLTPVLYAFLPDIARRMNVLEGMQDHKPYRDDYVYVFTPWAFAESSADRMARQAVVLASPQGMILVEDRMAEFAVRYCALQADASTRPEVISWNAVDPSAVKAIHGPIVWVPRDVSEEPPTTTGVEWRRDGDLWVGVSTDPG